MRRRSTKRAQINPTDAPIAVLVLGCGTGLELDGLFKKAPNARMTGGDRAEWNYDVTLSLTTETRIIRDAGFDAIEVTSENRDDTGNGLAVIVARK